MDNMLLQMARSFRSPDQLSKDMKRKGGWSCVNYGLQYSDSVERSFMLRELQYFQTKENTIQLVPVSVLGVEKDSSFMADMVRAMQLHNQQLEDMVQKATYQAGLAMNRSDMVGEDPVCKRIVWADGFYKGECKRSTTKGGTGETVMEGLGVLSTDEFVHCGKWKHNCFDGAGVIIRKDGLMAKAVFNSDTVQYEPKDAVLIYSDGDRYYGGINHCKREGWGRYVFNHTQLTIIGYWEGDNPSGLCILINKRIGKTFCCLCDQATREAAKPVVRKPKEQTTASDNMTSCNTYIEANTAESNTQGQLQTSIRRCREELDGTLLSFNIIENILNAKQQAL